MAKKITQIPTVTGKLIVSQRDSALPGGNRQNIEDPEYSPLAWIFFPSSPFSA